MRYKNWACEVPDLDPRAFRPVAGRMRLYGGDGGGDGGGGGDDAASVAASLGLDVGTPGTSTGPSGGIGMGIAEGMIPGLVTPLSPEEQTAVDEVVSAPASAASAAPSGSLNVVPSFGPIDYGGLAAMLSGLDLSQIPGAVVAEVSDEAGSEAGETEGGDDAGPTTSSEQDMDAALAAAETAATAAPSGPAPGTGGEVSTLGLDALGGAPSGSVGLTGGPAPGPATDPVEQAVLDSLSSLTAGNVVTNASGGGWGTGAGVPLASAGLNISLGLDPNAPGFGANAPLPDLSAQQNAVNVAAQMLGLTPEDLVGSSALDTGFLGEAPPSISTAGLDQGTLSMLSDAGLGSMEISPTQTVDQALASMEAHAFLNENIDTLMGMLVPGAGAMIAGTQALGGLLSGVITPQQALGHVAGPIAGLTMPGLVSNIVNSQAFQDATGLTPLSQAQIDAIAAQDTGVTPGIAETIAQNQQGESSPAPAPAPAPAAAPAPAPAPAPSGANLAGMLGLASLLGQQEEREERPNYADVRRGIAMSPFGLPYGG